MWLPALRVGYVYVHLIVSIVTVENRYLYRLMISDEIVNNIMFEGNCYSNSVSESIPQYIWPCKPNLLFLMLILMFDAGGQVFIKQFTKQSCQVSKFLDPIYR